MKFKYKYILVIFLILFLWCGVAHSATMQMDSSTRVTPSEYTISNTFWGHYNRFNSDETMLLIYEDYGDNDGIGTDTLPGRGWVWAYVSDLLTWTDLAGYQAITTQLPHNGLDHITDYMSVFWSDVTGEETVIYYTTQLFDTATTKWLRKCDVTTGVEENVVNLTSYVPAGSLGRLYGFKKDDSHILKFDYYHDVGDDRFASGGLLIDVDAEPVTVTQCNKATIDPSPCGHCEATGCQNTCAGDWLNWIDVRSNGHSAKSPDGAYYVDNCGTSNGAYLCVCDNDGDGCARLYNSTTTGKGDHFSWQYTNDWWTSNSGLNRGSTPALENISIYQMEWNGTTLGTVTTLVTQACPRGILEETHPYHSNWTAHFIHYTSPSGKYIIWTSTADKATSNGRYTKQDYDYFGSEPWDNTGLWLGVLSPAGGDTTAPVVTFNPYDGATGIAVASNVEIIFDEPVRLENDGEITDGVVVEGLITFKKTNAGGDDIAFAGTVNATKTKFTINPDANLPSEQVVYVAILGTTIEDASDNLAPASNATFTCINTDTPTLTWSPANNETGVFLDSTITITFDQAVRNLDDSEITDGEVVQALLTLKENDSDGDDIAYAGTINVGKTIITLTPSSNFSSGQTVYVAVASVEDADNNATAAANITFTCLEPSTTTTCTAGNKWDLSGDILAQWKLNDNRTTANISEETTSVWDGLLYTTDEVGYVSRTMDNSVVGKLVRAIEFDGSDDYIEIPGTADAFETLPLSFVVWMYSNNTPTATEAMMIKVHPDAPSYTWRLAHNNGGGVAMRVNNSGSTAFSVASNDVVSSGAWHHIVATVSATTMNLYVDGVLQNASGAQAVTDLYDSNGLARLSSVTGRTFDGVLDNVEIFNKELTAGDVANLYNNGTGTEALACLEGDTPPGSVYYVDSNATSGCDGLSFALYEDQNGHCAWDTIADITDALEPGNHVYVKRGTTYDETFTVPETGTAEAHYFFGAYGSGNKPCVNQIIVGSGIDYIDFDNWWVDDSDDTADGDGITVTDAQYVTFTECKVSNVHDHGIHYTTDSQNGAITDCEILDWGDQAADGYFYGIYGYDGSQGTISGCELYMDDGTDNGAAAFHSGIQINGNVGGGGTKADWTITDTLIHDCYNDGFTVYNNTVGTIVLSKSKIYDNGSEGIAVGSTANAGNIDIYYTLIYGNTGKNIYWHTNSDGGNLWNVVSYGSTHGIYIEDDCSLTAIQNCIFDGNSTENGGLFAEAGGAVTTLTYNCNTDGETVLSCGTGCITGDPLFVDAAGDDFTLQKTSPCIDAGSSSVGAAYDDAFDPRDTSFPYDTLDQDDSGTGWEIGAFVFRPALSGYVKDAAGTIITGKTCYIYAYEISIDAEMTQLVNQAYVDSATSSSTTGYWSLSDVTSDQEYLIVFIYGSTHGTQSNIVGAKFMTAN